MIQLTQGQIEQLKRLMSERHVQLRNDIVELLARTGEQSFGELAGTPEIGDKSVADLLVDLDNAMVHRDVQEIREIESAIDRIETNSYGVCIDCGLEIDFDRLLVSPTAIRCVVCQRQHERTHAHDTTPTL